LKINPSFPPFAIGRNYPSLEKRGDLPGRSRFGEGRGEICRRVCLLNYGLLS